MSKKVFLTLYRVSKCLIDSLSVLFEVKDAGLAITEYNTEAKKKRAEEVVHLSSTFEDTLRTAQAKVTESARAHSYYSISYGRKIK